MNFASITTTTQIEAIIGVFIPLLVGFLKQAKFPNVYNALIAIAVYVVVGLASVFLTGQTLSLANIQPAVALFVAEGTIAYAAFWKAFEGTALALRLRLGAGPTTG